MSGVQGACVRMGRGEACSGGERGRVEQEARGVGGPGVRGRGERKECGPGCAAGERKEGGERKRKDEKKKENGRKKKKRRGRERNEYSPAGFAAAAVTRSATRNVACARG